MNVKCRNGDIAEYAGMIWLAKQGYEVFRNFVCTGPIDVIAFKLETGESHLIDIKRADKRTLQDGTVRYYPPPSPKSAEQTQLGVKRLIVDDDIGHCWFEEDEGRNRMKKVG